MRTTVTLDPDTERIVRTRMKTRGVSFKRALNDSIRDGAGDHESPRPAATTVRSMGAPRIDLIRALDVAAELEDEAHIAKMARGR